MTKKIYFDAHLDDGGIVFWSQRRFDKYALRLAGVPKFLLQKYYDKYGEAEGKKRYQELLSMMLECSKEGHSPFVLYHYEHNDHGSLLG